VTFNIIYTPNTIQHLSFFIWSLLDNSKLSFRLVSNGCSKKEILELKEICSLSSRLSFFNFPSSRMQTHGIVLNILYHFNKEDYFCFMDSDIFATKPIPDFLLLFESSNLSASFSALPIWVRKRDLIVKSHFNVMFGTNNQTNDNRTLGSSYFAIYKYLDLCEIIKEYKVGFERIRWNQISPVVKKLLKVT